MESELEESNATPEAGGASTQDRLERFLAAQDAPDQPKQEPASADASEEPAASAQSVEPDEDGGEEQSQEPQLSTTDLAKYFGIEPDVLDLDEDGTVKLKTKVNGQDGAAKLADLLKSYQLEGHVNKRSMELAERERAMQQRQQEVEQHFHARLQEADRLAQAAQEDMLREFQSIDWDGLRQVDPGRAADLRLQYQERAAKINQIRQGVMVGNSQLNQQAEARRQEFVAKERARIPEVIPEWKDPGVATKESGELVEWCLKAGYSPQFVQALDKSSALEVATVRKAMLFDKLQKSKPEIENKVRQAPKLVKPGQSQPQDSKTAEIRNAKQEVRKTGGKHGSVAAYLLATGKV